jgi:hypothetical protein
MFRRSCGIGQGILANEKKEKEKKLEYREEDLNLHGVSPTNT